MMTVSTSPLDLAHPACDLRDFESMVRNVFAHPDDDLSRLIFADWLDDHGCSTWASLIRLQTQRLDETEERQLLQPLLHWLLRNLPARVAVEFHRGFLDLTINADQCAQNPVACRLLLGGLVDNLRLVAHNSEPTIFIEPGDPLTLAGTLDLRKCRVNFISLSRLAGLELPLSEGRLQRVLLSEAQEADVRALRGQGRAAQAATSLDFNNWDTLLREEDVRRMVETPYLENVRDITLTRHELGDVLLNALGRASCGANLQRLFVHERAGVTDQGVLDFLKGAGWLVSLRHLDLSGNSITDAGLRALLQSPLAERLDHLNVTDNVWGDAGALVLAEYTSRWGWNSLDLTGATISDDGLEALSESGHVHNFQILNLQNAHGFSDAGLSMLARSPGWASLIEVRLSTSQVRPATVFELILSPSLLNLRTIYHESMTAHRLPATKRRPLGVQMVLREGETAWFDFMKSMPNREQIHSLVLSLPIDTDAVADLLAGPGWTGLRELAFIDCGLTDVQLASILARADLPVLERLDLTRNQIGAKGVRLLAGWPGMEQLRELALGENRLGDRGALELYTERKFAKLENLAVHDNRLSRHSADGLMRVFRGRVKGCGFDR